MIIPPLEFTDILRPAYRAWIKIGPGRRSSTARLPSKYDGAELREIRRLHGVGRPVRA